MIRGRDFIFTGLQPWELPIGSNARDIAREVSRHNRVLYVDTPLALGEGRGNTSPDVAQRARAAKRLAPTLRTLGPNLYVLDLPMRVLPVNGLPDGALFDAANRINNRRIFRYVSKAAAKLGFGSVIHFIDNDIYRSYYAQEYLRPALSIYYRRDNVLTVDYWQRHGQRLEPRLMAAADLVVSNSAHLADRAQECNPRSFDIGQGVELAGYDEALELGLYAPALEAIPHPIVGYIGNITSLRLDPELIFILARSNPGLSFVLVGPEDAVFSGHSLHSLDNVFFPGAIPPEAIPSYINSFDICINPQQVNETTIGNYPRKIDEYLAMGKPTVATRTRGMEMFGSHVRLCDTADDYQRAFVDILAGITPAPAAECIRFAHTHTWTASVDKLYEAIAKFNPR